MGKNYFIITFIKSKTDTAPECGSRIYIVIYANINTIRNDKNVIILTRGTQFENISKVFVTINI